MTYEDFFKVVMDLYCQDKTWWDHGNEDHYEVKWVTGGMGGGSCWGDEPYRMGSDPEEFIDLATLFDRVCPAMTYRQHSSVMGAVLETTYGTEYEYYGNYTDYGIKRVNYRRLYDALVAEGLISGD